MSIEELRKKLKEASMRTRVVPEPTYGFLPSPNTTILSHHRSDEPWRKTRVAIAFGAAMSQWIDRGGKKSAFNDLFFRWHDHKGNLLVFARQPFDDDVSEIITRAWNIVDEETVEEYYPASFNYQFAHEVEPDHDYDGIAHGVRVKHNFFSIGFRCDIDMCDALYQFQETYGYQPVFCGQFIWFKTDDEAVWFVMKYGQKS